MWHPCGAVRLALRPEAGRGANAAALDDPTFICEDDNLDAVAEPELGEDAGDVGLYGSVAHEQGRRDLGVRQAACHELEDFELAGG